jgi:hypothetical protein
VGSGFNRAKKATVIANEREATQLMNIERAQWLHRALFYFY